MVCLAPSLHLNLRNPNPHRRPRHRRSNVEAKQISLYLRKIQKCTSDGKLTGAESGRVFFFLDRLPEEDVGAGEEDGPMLSESVPGGGLLLF